MSNCALLIQTPLVFHVRYLTFGDNRFLNSFDNHFETLIRSIKEEKQNTTWSFHQQSCDKLTVYCLLFYSCSITWEHQAAEVNIMDRRNKQSTLHCYKEGMIWEFISMFLVIFVFPGVRKLFFFSFFPKQCCRFLCFLIVTIQKQGIPQ